MLLKETFPQNRKMTHPYNLWQKVTYSNLPIKLWKERKYVIELILVKSYKKGLIFPVINTVIDITNHWLKLAKVFSQLSIPQYTPILPNKEYSGDIKAC